MSENAVSNSSCLIAIVLDDKKARRIAKQLGLKVMGTVGLLLRAKKIGKVTEIKPILDALQEAYRQGLFMANVSVRHKQLTMFAVNKGRRRSGIVLCPLEDSF